MTVKGAFEERDIVDWVGRVIKPIELPMADGESRVQLLRPGITLLAGTVLEGICLVSTETSLAYLVKDTRNTEYLLSLAELRNIDIFADY